MFTTAHRREIGGLIKEGKEKGVKRKATEPPATEVEPSRDSPVRSLLV